MGKLVRDKIPDIIRASGRTPRVTTLGTHDYRTALCDKLREEVTELLAADGADVIEEAADILEVLTAIAAEHGATIDSIVDIARRKREQRGGFEMRLWLESVESAEPLSITVTETPRLANPAERRTWQMLVDQLEPNDLVIPGQRVTDHLKDHEADFVVAIEGAGIVCLEVKGGEVWHDGEGWRQKRGGHEHRIDPVRQAREACYALRDYIEKDPRWSQGRLRWDHVVVLPNTELPADFELPDCPRWKVVDRNDLPSLVDKLRYVLVRQELERPLLTREGIDQLATALSGRGLPQRDVVARALANEDAADALTEHQAVILDATRLLNRVEVRGGAGSGKTFLAMEQARRLARQGQRVALVCYSHGLASYLERIAATWPRRQQPAYVGEFHALGVQWGAPEGPDEALRTDETVRFWEHDLPLQMADLAAQLEPGHRFDSVVVDEAQDFADAWWDPLLAALKDTEDGGIYVFTDEGQRVFNRHGSPPVPLVPLILDHNVRNTRQIANAFQPLVDHPMRFLGGEGPAVKFVEVVPVFVEFEVAVPHLRPAGW